jgi:hypothetical protein
VEGENGEERGGPRRGMRQHGRPDSGAHGRRGAAMPRGRPNRGGEEGADRWAAATVPGTRHGPIGGPEQHNAGRHEFKFV